MARIARTGIIPASAFFLFSFCTSAVADVLPLGNRFPTMLPFLGIKPLALELDDRLDIALEHASVNFLSQSNQYVARFDFELTHLSMRWQKHLEQNWLISAEVPVISLNSGVFDEPIDEFHQLFNLPESGREQRPTNEYLYRFEMDGETIASADNGQLMLGDIKLAADYIFAASDDAKWALRTEIELPVAGSGSAVSNGSWDFGFSLLYQSPSVSPDSESWLNNLASLTKNIGYHWQLGWYMPGDWQGKQVDLQAQSGWQAALGIALPLDSRWLLASDVLIQQSPLQQTGIGALDNRVATIGAGVQWIPEKNHQWSLFFIEDLNTAATVDVGLILNWSLATAGLLSD